MRLVFWFKISGVNNTGNLANKIFANEQKRNIDSAKSMGMKIIRFDIACPLEECTSSLAALGLDDT
mgnify:CR=1 FL=1|jgi:hypothetical protein